MDGRGQTRRPVTFDPLTRELRIGEHVAVVADDDNEGVLRAYLTLVTRARGRAVRTGADLRHDDIVALAQVLDLDDVDLESRLVRLLGLSRGEAADVHRRLRARAAAAATAMAAG